MKTFPKCCEPGAPLKSSSSGRNGRADRTTCIPDPVEVHDAVLSLGVLHAPALKVEAALELVAPVVRENEVLPGASLAVHSEQAAAPSHELLLDVLGPLRPNQEARAKVHKLRQRLLSVYQDVGHSSLRISSDSSL